MTREEMRRQVEAACDYGLKHPYLVGADNVKLLKAVRELAATDDASLDRLAAIYTAQNARVRRKPKVARKPKE